MKTLQVYLQQSWEDIQKRRYGIVKENNPQPFLEIQGDKIRARNYLGVLQVGEYSIYLLPKLFEKENIHTPVLKAMQAHWWWWLSYSRLLHYPRLGGRLQRLLDQPLECFIDLFTDLCKERMLPLRIQYYQQERGNQKRLRGKLDLQNHLQQNISRGQWQRLYCQYDKLEIDERPYQLLKYCFRLLQNYSKDKINQKKLADLVFDLKNTTDVTTEQQEWQSLRLSPLHADMQELIDDARLFLRQLIPSLGGVQAPSWSLLFPAEQLFESFLSGFIQSQAPRSYRVELQEQKRFLSRAGSFALRPDIVIYNGNGAPQIVDVKYKRLRPEHWERDILQADLYQLLAYGLRYASTELHLLYPSSGSWRKVVAIDSPLQNTPFRVQIHGLPVQLSATELAQWDTQIPIQKQFASLKQRLQQHLQGIFEPALF